MLPAGEPLREDFSDGNWPIMGVSGSMDEPEKSVFFSVEILLVASLGTGRLYNHVATRTMLDPITNSGVMRKLNSMTEARKERMIERLVAKPFRMLSEYLMTRAVTRPPNTCIPTVPHAHHPKFLNRSKIIPRESGRGVA